jgi:hypothetical protein
MISSDSHFFTNKEGLTVLERFENLIFQDLTPLFLVISLPKFDVKEDSFMLGMFGEITFKSDERIK